MSIGESPGPDIALDEIAPSLVLLWDPEKAQPAHYSNLVPDPEAQVNMKTWAKLYSQIKALDQWDEITACAELAGEDIMVNFPVYGSFNDDGPCTTIYCSFSEFMGDGPTVIGRRGFTLGFDLTRPGYVTAHEGTIALPEKVEPYERLAECQPLGEPEEGLYMTSEGSGVGYRFASYVMTQSTAEAICGLLSQANLSDEEVQEKHFEAGLEHMDPTVREAVHRHYVLGKHLNKSPEEAFKPSEWWWRSLPSQFCNHPNAGIMADHHDKLEAYAPPGGKPCDGEAINAFMGEVRQVHSWVRATWEKEQLPDNFDALFTEPTNLEALSPFELIEAMPEDMKENVARWAQEQLFWRRNWVEHTFYSVNGVADMDEAEFNDRKRKAEAGEGHFRWSSMPSFRSCLESALGVGNTPSTYPEWMARYDERAQQYEDFYNNYASVIEEYPKEDRSLTSRASMWKSPEERQEIYKTAWKVFQKLAALPAVPESENA